jgi:hypothetical protein
LEWAAKAAGYSDFTHCELCGGSPALYLKEAHLGIWAPLTDDGDALRLAVKLNINVFIYGNETSTGTIGVVGTGWGSKEANTRRAIVRAAAEIGKGMP